ncbi:MAG: hypothetical protein Gaeavirus11_17 [Gaeavirus sp.]|uniref:Uncharacterized protein n=1 Tax=Gaeavirus sp. TaxID=2487767 RepID=A0A3G4ZZ01_9VIRU|nr:MAG: hypothetical protein Gaeavirus11_17 [Gaeavirus sp.]
MRQFFLKCDESQKYKDDISNLQDEITKLNQKLSDYETVIQELRSQKDNPEHETEQVRDYNRIINWQIGIEHCIRHIQDNISEHRNNIANINDLLMKLTSRIIEREKLILKFNSDNKPSESIITKQNIIYKLVISSKL